MNPNTNRSALMGVVGGYLIYLAYELLKALIDHVPTTMPMALQIVVIILFTGAGGTLLVFAWKLWKKGREEQDENPVEITDREDRATNEQDASEK